MIRLQASGWLLRAALLLLPVPVSTAQTSGLPEHALAGVNIDGDDVEAQLRRLGPPDKVTDRKHADGGGEREYEWDREGVRLSVRVADSVDAAGVRVLGKPVQVSLWGDRRYVFAHTGAGLYLSDDRSRIRQIYGRHIEKVAGGRTVVHWQNGTALAIDVDRLGHVVHMELAGSDD